MKSAHHDSRAASVYSSPTRPIFKSGLWSIQTSGFVFAVRSVAKESAVKVSTFDSLTFTNGMRTGLPIGTGRAV
jgi:hypothetical protein